MESKNCSARSKYFGLDDLTPILIVRDDCVETLNFDPGGQLLRKLIGPCQEGIPFEGLAMLKFEAPIETSCLLLDLIDVNDSVESLSFDPGGKLKDILEAMVAKELSQPLTHQVFYKIPKLQSGHKPEMLDQLSKGMKEMDCDKNYALAEIEDEVQNVERFLISPSYTRLQIEIDISTVMAGINIPPLLKFDYWMHKLDYMGEYAFDPGGGSLLLTDSLELECGEKALLFVGDSLKLKLVLLENSNFCFINKELTEMINLPRAAIFGFDMNQSTLLVFECELTRTQVVKDSCVAMLIFDPGGDDLKLATRIVAITTGSSGYLEAHLLRPLELNYDESGKLQGYIGDSYFGSQQLMFDPSITFEQDYLKSLKVVLLTLSTGEDGLKFVIAGIPYIHGGGEHFNIFAGSKASMCYYVHTSKVAATLSFISYIYVQPVVLLQVVDFEIKLEHGNLVFEVDRLMSSPKDYFQVVDFQLRSQEYHLIEMDYISTDSSSAKTEVVELYCELSFEFLPLILMDKNVASFRHQLGVEVLTFEEFVCVEEVTAEVLDSREGIAMLFVFDPGEESFGIIDEAQDIWFFQMIEQYFQYYFKIISSTMLLNLEDKDRLDKGELLQELCRSSLVTGSVK